MSFQTRKTFIHLRNTRYFWLNQSSLTLHRQQHNWTVPRPRNVVRTSVKQSMWHQWLGFNFAKIQEYFLCAKKKIIYSTILLPEIPSSAILESTMTHVFTFTRKRMHASWKLEIHYSIYKDSLHAFNVELATARQTFFSNLRNSNFNNTRTLFATVERLTNPQVIFPVKCSPTANAMSLLPPFLKH